MRSIFFPFSVSSAISTINSRQFKANRASPLTYSASTCSKFSSKINRSLPNPRLGSSTACCKTCSISAVVSDFSTYTLARESNALFSSKEGFSVVAPIKITVPSSMCGKNASCWLLLKRWTSSTNKIVLRSARRFCFARSIASRISLIPLVTAEIRSTSALIRCAMISARVVFPVPGGPHKIIE